MTFVLRVLENLDSAPGPVAVALGNATTDLVGFDVTFTIDADSTVLYTTEMPDDGTIRAYVPIPAGTTVGLHTLTAHISGDDSTAEFSVINAPIDDGDQEDDVDLTAPDIPEPFERWTFIDVHPTEGETWTMPRNPASWDGPPERPNWMTFDAAVGPSGQILTWQNSGTAWSMTFKGITKTAEEYADLLRWAQKRRRFWLYDHRHMIWALSFTQFQAIPRNRGFVDGQADPWLCDYSMVCMVFNRPNDDPFVIEETVAIP